MKVKIILLGIVLIFDSIKIMAQELNESSFDFWVGNWEVTWTNPDGSEIIGSNKIVRTLNEKVIQENFRDPSTSFEGTSISVYSPYTKKWHQAWADSDGSFYNFEGDIIDGEPVFQTKMVERNGEKFLIKVPWVNDQI